MPLFQSRIGIFAGDVVYQNSDFCVTIVHLGQRGVLLLAGGIPDLEFVSVPFIFKIFILVSGSEGGLLVLLEFVHDEPLEQTALSDPRASEQANFNLDTFSHSEANECRYGN